MQDDEHFRREDDRRWRERIENLESRVVSLTSAQKTTDDDIDDLATKIAEQDQLLRGDHTERDMGLLGQINAMETSLNSILRVWHPDSMGHGGFLQEFSRVRDKVFGKEKDRAHWFMLWAKIIGVIGSIAAVAISTWPSLSSYWKETSKDMKVLERKMNKVKHPHVPRYVPKVEEDAE